MRSLREAVKKAARPRLIRGFIDEGKTIQNLLLKTFNGTGEITSATTSFGLELIGIFARAHPRSDSGKTLPPGQEIEPLALPEHLNERESEIIRMVAVGMSNKEIGGRLGLTEGSVKWYLQQIFEKLNVRRRSTAVFQARKFGII